LISMKIALAKTVVLHGLLLAGLSYLLSLVKLKFLIRELSVEFYVGVVALVFTALGVWMGSKLVRKKREPVEQFIIKR
jgi:NarL family two-component system response regulator LiaR